MKKVMDFVLYCMALPLVYILSVLPSRWAAWGGRLVGRIAFFIDRRHRLITLRNLEIAFPETSLAWRTTLARQCFENFGKTIFELPALLHMPEDRILQMVKFEGVEHYLEARAQKKGVLLLTAHIGNWELMALAHGLQGYKLNFVARPLDNPYMNRWITRFRMRSGNHIIPKKGGFRGVYAALKRGESVGLLMDQAVTGSDGVFVDFFGQKAGTSRAMAILACRFNSPVLPTYIYREPDDMSHRVVVGPPVPLTITSNKNQDIIENTQRFQHALEGIIRRHPEQWFWMHRRWKRSPSLGKGREGYPPKNWTKIR